jgi:hypothetical protein
MLDATNAKTLHEKWEGFFNLTIINETIAVSLFWQTFQECLPLRV